MPSRYYFLYYDAETDALNVTEVSKHKFENTRGYEDLSRPGGIPHPVRMKISEMSAQEPTASYRLFMGP